MTLPPRRRGALAIIVQRVRGSDDEKIRAELFDMLTDCGVTICNNTLLEYCSHTAKNANSGKGNNEKSLDTETSVQKNHLEKHEKFQITKCDSWDQFFETFLLAICVN